MFHRSRLNVATPGRGFTDITSRLQTYVATQSVSVGQLHIMIRHTSASLIVCENADPQVLADMEAWMSRLVTDGDSVFGHTAEGQDDMAAHVRTVLTLTDLTVPVESGQLMLGTWQGVFLWEHRYRGHDRELILTLSGDD